MKYEYNLLIRFRDLSPYSRAIKKFHLDYFKLSSFIGRYNITVPVRKGDIWYGWLTDEETGCNNASIT